MDTPNQPAHPLETPVSSHLVATPVHNQKNFLGIIVGTIVLFIFIAVGAYYLGTQNSSKQLQQNYLLQVTPTVFVQTETLSPSPVPVIGTKTNNGTITVDDTTNEKVYTSTAVNFSIRIPKDWEIDDKPGVFIASPGEVVFAPAGTDTLSPFSLKIALTTAESSNARFPYGTESEFNQKLAEPVSPGTGQSVYKIGNIKIDGKDAVQYVNRTLPQGFYAVITWVRHNGINYYFELEPSEKEVKTYLDTYNSTIATVKFTN